MKSSSGHVFAAFALVLLSGCAGADVEFTPYSGGQRNWPIATGSFVQRNFSLPVFVNSPPDRPYRIIGYVEVQNARGGARHAQSASIKAAVAEAMKHGADGVILLESGTDVAGVYSAGSAYGNAYSAGRTSFGSASGFGFSVPIRKGHARAIAIKFVST